MRTSKSKEYCLETAARARVMKVVADAVAITFLLVATLAVVAPSVRAECDCGPALSLDASVEAADVVFLGQVLEVRENFSLHPGHTYVRLMPAKKFKGQEHLLNPDAVVIFTPEKSKECNLKFIKGNDYLVFAKGNPAFLATSVCDRTGIQESRKDDIHKLVSKQGAKKRKR